MKDYHVILGIPKGAGLRTIRKAYRKLARQYHPDPHQGRKAMLGRQEILLGNTISLLLGCQAA